MGVTVDTVDYPREMFTFIKRRPTWVRLRVNGITDLNGRMSFFSQKCAVCPALAAHLCSGINADNEVVVQNHKPEGNSTPGAYSGRCGMKITAVE